MPLIPSSYKAPWYLRNADVHTIISPLLRTVKGISYSRERIATPDDDFLDIDWVKNDSKKIALLIHGLEASASSAYVKGMAKKLSAAGFNVAAMNLRGCSGEVNRQLRAYHSGATDDVSTVVNFILKNYACEELVIIGFSLGGNLTLKYLGEKGNELPHQIKKAVAISVPCDLQACAVTLDERSWFVYKKRFLKTLKQKAIARIHLHKNGITKEKIIAAKSLQEYDDAFTAPLFEFKNAADYYTKCSSKQFIKDISVPTLILTAVDDPFFTKDCLPYKECKLHQKVFLETPMHGGHVGFVINPFSEKYFAEGRTLEWLQQVN